MSHSLRRWSAPVWPRRIRRITLGLAATLAGIANTHAADSVAWVDWHTKTDTSVSGSITLGDELVDVTYSGPYFHAFLDTFPEPYRGPYDQTYLSTAVTNRPENRDAITIAGGPDDLKLSFSTPLFRPFVAVASLGLTNAQRSVTLGATMDFEQDFLILSQGPNYYADGEFTPFSTQGRRLVGIESSGVIQFSGTHEEINWKSPFREETDGVLVGTYMFTVGASCDNYDIGPNPLTAAAVVPRGCTALNRAGQFGQQADVEVRGTLINRNGWLQGAPVTVGPDGTLDNPGIYTVGELQTLTVDGTLRNFGALIIRGSVHLRGDAAADSSGTIVLRGDNTFAEGGQLQNDAGTSLSSTGRVTVEDHGQIRVGGMFNSSGMLEVSLAGTIETLATGTLELAGSSTIAGTLLNRGTARVTGGGSLIFDRAIDLIGLPPNLDNFGTMEVDEGASLQGGPLGRVRNRQGGTLQIDGSVQADGVLENAGMINLGASGELVGNFTQKGGGQLDAPARCGPRPASISISTASRISPAACHSRKTVPCAWRPPANSTSTNS